MWWHNRRRSITGCLFSCYIYTWTDCDLDWTLCFDSELRKCWDLLVVTWVGTVQRKKGSCDSPWQLGCLSCNTSATLWVSAPGPMLPFLLLSVEARRQKKKKGFKKSGQIFAKASRFVAKYSALTLSFSNRSDNFSNCLKTVKSNIVTLY